MKTPEADQCSPQELAELRLHELHEILDVSAIPGGQGYEAASQQVRTEVEDLSDGDFAHLKEAMDNMAGPASDAEAHWADMQVIVYGNAARRGKKSEPPDYNGMSREVFEGGKLVTDLFDGLDNDGAIEFGGRLVQEIVNQAISRALTTEQLQELITAFQGGTGHLAKRQDFIGRRSNSETSYDADMY